MLCLHRSAESDLSLPWRAAFVWVDASRAYNQQTIPPMARDLDGSDKQPNRKQPLWRRRLFEPKQPLAARKKTHWAKTHSANNPKSLKTLNSLLVFWVVCAAGGVVGARKEPSRVFTPFPLLSPRVVFPLPALGHFCGALRSPTEMQNRASY
jgi:hypothetical protein